MAGLTYTPIEGDPFAAPVAAAPKLTPLDGDPFAAPASQAQYTPLDGDPFGAPSSGPSTVGARYTQLDGDPFAPPNFDDVESGSSTSPLHDVGLGEAAERGIVSYGAKAMGLLNALRYLDPGHVVNDALLERAAKEQGATPAQLEELRNQQNPLRSLIDRADEYEALKPGETEGLPAQVVQRGIPAVAELANAAATGARLNYPRWPAPRARCRTWAEASPASSRTRRRH